MIASTKTSWAHDIRRYIYEMLILLVTFTVVTSGYYKWHESLTETRRSISNNYHRATTSHYLLAMSELRQEQLHLSHDSAASPDAEALPAPGIKAWSEHNHAAGFYQVQQKIQSGLRLQQTYADNRFDALTAKLEQQLAAYEQSNERYLHSGRPSQQLVTDLENLLTSLDQLVSLHAIVDDALLVDLEQLELRQTIAFYLLASLLLGAGLFLMIRSLRAISVIIAQRQQTEEKMRYQAHFDSLTDLPNRFLSLDRLSQLLKEAWRNDEQVAVLFLDLDDFKKINDSLGHDTGDKLLVEAGNRIQEAVRSGDTVGRLGGDEFIVILGRVTDVPDIQLIVEDLMQLLRKPFRIGARELIITASVGICVYPGDGQVASELLRKADAAMYHSKKSGRNTYSFFTESMNRQATRRLAVEEQIHGALDRGEFSVVYQPLFDLNRSEITGAEALLRWNNPALGTLNPDEFIPIAEHTGLILSIGQFVLQQALHNTTSWSRQQNADFRIAVNLSPRQFRDPELVGFIESTLQEHGIPSQQLELEITEGVLLSGHKYVDQALGELSQLGVTIAMDDFGVGYSSLNYLRKYPFDVVKIDRSFVQGIESNSQDRELINAAISMAHALNLKVVAEGVETEQQFDYLKSGSCDYAQGFLLGKPMPAEELTEILLARADAARHEAESGVVSITRVPT